MPASVTEGAVLFRRKDGSNAWWSTEEEKILVNRILRDDPTKGDMNNRQAVDMKGIWGALTNIDLWPLYIVSLAQILYITLVLTHTARRHRMDPISAHRELPIPHSPHPRVLCFRIQPARHTRICHFRDQRARRRVGVGESPRAFSGSLHQ